MLQFQFTHTVSTWLLFSMLVLVAGCQEDIPDPVSADILQGRWKSECQSLDTSGLAGIEGVGYQRTFVEFTGGNYHIQFRAHEDADCVMPLTSIPVRGTEYRGNYFVSPNHFHTPSGQIGYHISFYSENDDVVGFNTISRSGGILYFSLPLPGVPLSSDIPEELDFSVSLSRF